MTSQQTERRTDPPLSPGAIRGGCASTTVRRPDHIAATNAVPSVGGTAKGSGFPAAPRKFSDLHHDADDTRGLA